MQKHLLETAQDVLADKQNEIGGRLYCRPYSSGMSVPTYHPHRRRPPAVSGADNGRRTEMTDGGLAGRADTDHDG